MVSSCLHVRRPLRPWEQQNQQARSQEELTASDRVCQWFGFQRGVPLTLLHLHRKHSSQAETQTTGGPVHLLPGCETTTCHQAVGSNLGGGSEHYLDVLFGVFSSVHEAFNLVREKKYSTFSMTTPFNYHSNNPNPFN